MHGADTFTESLFTMRYLDEFVSTNRALHTIRVVVNAALIKMDSLRNGMYEADTKG